MVRRTRIESPQRDDRVPLHYRRRRVPQKADLRLQRLKKLLGRIRERGLLWTWLWYSRWFVARLIRRIDYLAIAIEKRRFITGDATVSSLYHTVDENRRIWNTYDWSRRGEEWTDAAKEYRGLDPSAWKHSLIEGVMRKYVRSGSTTLEIGPGAGRWTEHLVSFVGTLHLADISEKCLSLCQQRFRGNQNIQYHLIQRDGLSFVPPNSIDCVWSYDVFVHIAPTDIEGYVRDLARVMRPGGVAVIHHSGSYRTAELAESSFRSHMNAPLFAHLVREYGLEMIDQDTSLPHKPGDVISVFRKPSLSGS